MSNPDPEELGSKTYRDDVLGDVTSRAISFARGKL